MKSIVILYLIACCEGGPDGALDSFGPYNMTQAAITDVNEFYGTNFGPTDVRDSLALANAAALLYLNRWEATDSYEWALRTWKAGPKPRMRRDSEKYVWRLLNWLEKSDAYWERAEDELSRIRRTGIIDDLDFNDLKKD